MTINPPPYVKKFDYQGCIQINDPITNKRSYQTPEGEKLPSVTTILSATEDKSAILEWKKRVGEDKAAKIVKEASGVGTSMHKNIENFITGVQRQPGGNLVHVQSNKMADVIIKNAFCDIDEIWAYEQSLYYPGLYSGTTDLVGVYKGEPAVMDYKQSNKIKKSEYVNSYRMQLVAYILAHNAVYGTNICRGVIFMAVRPPEIAPGIYGEPIYQQFDLLSSDFNYWEDQWLNRVEKYYKLFG
jgi:genome maintenance exonuclease 1